MVSVAKPWLICGYYGLTILTMFFFYFIFLFKTMVHFRKGLHWKYKIGCNASWETSTYSLSILLILANLVDHSVVYCINTMALLKKNI